MDRQRTTPNFFAGPYLDRLAEPRTDSGWLDDARRDTEARFVVVRGTTHLLLAEPEPRVAFLPGDHPAVAGAEESRTVLLGRFRGTRCVLVEVEDDAEALAAGARFEELRPLTNTLPEEDAALLAYVRALSVWRARHRHCGACGTPTAPTRGGHVLRCPNFSCGLENFPRIDPAIIVLVTQGDRALLGRQPAWPPERYSTIAGFVEPGESLEDAVAREVLEETGVRVGEVRYASSQPWPFPSSLMLGFHAEAASTGITLADGELEDARWFTREDIAGGRPLLPTRFSISYRLIESWFDAGAAVPLAAQPRVGRWDAKRA